MEIEFFISFIYMELYECLNFVCLFPVNIKKFLLEYEKLISDYVKKNCVHPDKDPIYF
jgi:hypothetical protein